MANDNDRLIRHAAIDRLFHWVTAATMTVLLATSLLPIIGVRFAWYQIHWIAGIILTLMILLHIIRTLFWQRLRTITPRISDLTGQPAGKYTLAPETDAPGHGPWPSWSPSPPWLFMMVKAGVPFLQRDPYVYSLKTWGLLTLLHDPCQPCCPFSDPGACVFRHPSEKRAYLRAMVWAGSPAPNSSPDMMWIGWPEVTEAVLLAERIEVIERGYEFLLAYAAQGRQDDAGTEAREKLDHMHLA